MARPDRGSPPVDRRPPGPAAPGARAADEALFPYLAAAIALESLGRSAAAPAGEMAGAGAHVAIDSPAAPVETAAAIPASLAASHALAAPWLTFTPPSVEAPPPRAAIMAAPLAAGPLAALAAPDGALTSHSAAIGGGPALPPVGSPSQGLTINLATAAPGFGLAATSADAIIAPGFASHAASVGEPGAEATQGITQTSSAGGGLVINISFDASVSGAPAGFTTAVDTAVAYLESLFSTPITININVGYGEIGGSPLSSGALGESSGRYVTETYAGVRSALLSQGAPGSATLPLFSPFAGAIELTRAEAKALLLLPASGATDGSVGFSSSFPFDYTNAAVAGQYYFIGVFEHEITEIMGRVSFLDQQPSSYTPIDLFRYLSSGTRDLATGGSGATAYFSIDNGATNLGSWNNNPSNGDLADWYPSGPAPGGHDAFNDFSNSGVLNVVSAGDITLMNALGYAPMGSVTPAVTGIVETPPSGVLDAGQPVTITLDFNEAMAVTGAPTLSLNDGGVAALTSGVGTLALNFTYVVGAADTNVASLQVTTVNLNGGTIEDSGNNAASLTLTGLTQTGPAIDTTIPALTSVGESPASGVLNAGKPVTFTLGFSEAVIVSGAPTLTLNDGAVVTYASGSGSTALKFSYTVGVADANVASLAVTAVNLDGGSIKDAGGNSATLSLAGLAQAGPSIDTTIPTITAILETPPSGVETAGKLVTFALDFSEAVTVSGAPTLSLDNGAKATFAGGSGSSALSFTYAVGAGDADIAALAATALNLAGGSIKDAGGNAANLSLAGLSQTGPEIDATAPAVVSILDSPASGVLNAGKAVTLTLNLNEKVTVVGAPTLVLNDGGLATYSGGSGGTALTFSYVVGAHDASVAALTVTSVNQAGSIRDDGGSTLTGALPVQTGPAIDTSVPTITAVVENPASGVLSAGRTATLTLDFSEAIAVVGAPTLTLNDGGVANYASGSGTNALVFNYIVGASDMDAASLAASAVNLAGGSIKDTGGNAASLSLAGLTQAGPEIDATVPDLIGIVDSPASGVLNAGTTVTFTLDLNEKVTVTGSPTLTLNDGGSANFLGGSGTNALTFSYTVGAHDTNEAALLVTAVNQVGGSIKDDGGNAATLSLTGLVQTGPAIDTTIPVVTAIVDAPAAGPLNVGKTVALTVSFNELVTVTGAPTLTLNDGGTAAYQSGSGSGALTFGYTVGASDANVASLSVTALNLAGGSIADAGANAANLSLAGLVQSGPQIVTTAPTITGVMDAPAGGALNAGKTVTITLDLSETVNVTGTPSLTLNNEGMATYVSGSGTAALVFAYQVGASDTDVAALAASAVNLAGGSIKDAAGNAANLSLAGLIQSGPAIDATVPTVSAVADAPASGTLKAGAAVSLTVSFNEAVIVAGTPTLSLNDGGTASYQSGSGTGALVFAYQVGASDTDVAALAASAINLAGGSIKDAGGNAAGLSLAGLTQGGPAIDTSVPHLTALAEIPATGPLYAGKTETLTLSFSEAVGVTGTPTLSLNDGGTATYQSGSGTNALTFSYTVGAHDASVASLAVTAVNLSGGQVADAGGNGASLSLAGLVQAGPPVESPADLLSGAFTNVLIASPTGALATTPSITLADGSSVANPIYTFAQDLPGLVAQVNGGQMTMAQALTTAEHWGDASTSVATVAYEFFTGAIPSSGGYGFLVNGTINPNDLDSPYYAQFDPTNRFINFASNLGNGPAGEAAFSAAYGSLSLSDALGKAYGLIFGFNPIPGQIASLLALQVAPGETRADYFAYYGQDGLTGLGTKAAAIGWLMAVAVSSGLGAYAAANDNFLAALAVGDAQFNTDFFGLYGADTGAQAAQVVAFLTTTAGQSLASLTAPLQVADQASGVAANLDALQALAGAHQLAAITLTDPTTPTLALTAPQVAADAGAIALISSAYAIAVTGTAAQLNGESLGHFPAAGSSLDLTDLNHSALGFSASFAENAAATQGTLTLSDGSHTAAVTLVGQLAAAGFSGTASAAGFTFTGDSAAGTTVGWHH